MVKNVIISMMVENLTEDQAQDLMGWIIKFAEDHGTVCGGSIYPVDENDNPVKWTDSNEQEKGS